MGFMSKSGRKSNQNDQSIESFYNPSNMSSEKTIIGKTIRIEGEVKSEEDVIIEGNVNGKVEVGKTLTIGKHGHVNAEIKARVVRIVGKVEGNIEASYKVEIVPNGHLTGNIKAPKIVIAEGAIFKGNVDMKTNEKVITPTEVTPPAIKKGEKESTK